MKKSFSVDFKENFLLGGFKEVTFFGIAPKFNLNNEPSVILDKETYRIRFKLNETDRSNTFNGTEYSLSVTYFDGPQGFLRICYSSIFLPDAILTLTQDAEGDATVFDLNGTVAVTDIADSADTEARSIFYEIRSESWFKQA